MNDVFVDGSGTVPEMLDSFTQELTELIQKNVSGSDSDLAKTLEAHIGKESDLMNALDPKSTEGIPHIIQERIQETLSSVLDSTNSSSPIAKLLLNIKEVTEEGDLSRTAQIEEITKILDANNAESPIARLLREVNVAVEGSALSILKQSIEDTLQTQNTTIQKIHDMVLETMTAKKTAEGTTLQGVEFEEQVGACLDEIASELNFDNDDVGHTTGVIPNCKKGDFVLCARPDSNTPTLRVVCEAKSDRSYNNVTKAVDESITCMENRAASSAIFVFNSSRAKDTFGSQASWQGRSCPIRLQRFNQHGSIACSRCHRNCNSHRRKIQQTKPRKRLLQVLLDDSKMSTSAMRLLRNQPNPSSRMAQKSRVK